MTDTLEHVELPPGQAHNMHAYRKYGCRCDVCLDAYVNRYRIKDRRRGICCHCDTCDFATELAVDMHEHTLRAHGRYLTDNERTPRK